MLLKKNGYCVRHENGQEKIKKQITKIDYNIAKQDEINSEIYILDIIKNFKEVKTCSRIERRGNIFDIKYQFFDEKIERGLQIKILRQNKQKSWETSSCHHFPENTLIVFLNVNRSRFALFYSQNCPLYNVRLSFSSNNKYKNNCFTNVEEFKNQLIIYMKKSIEYKLELKTIYNKITEINRNKNGERYKIINDKKILLCNFKNEITSKYCENIRQKNGYCRKHENGFEKVKKPFTTIIKNDDGSTKYSNQEYREQQKNSTIIGNETEIYVLNIIKEFKEIKSCSKIGETGDKCDIKYQFYDEDFERGLQVKTLRQRKGDENIWESSYCNNYLENTLLVFINQERNKFALISYKNCPYIIGFSFFPNSRSKYKNNIFTNIDEFKKKLLIYMKNSIIYKEQISNNQLIEKDNLLRLQKKCKENNFSFNLADTFTSIYDCIINNFKIQCKFTSTKQFNQYMCTFRKIGPSLNGKHRNISYSDKDDFDFVIIEICDYKNQFYIIPVQEFIDHKIFSSSTEKGLTCIAIPPPNYTNKKSKYFWILQYLNRFDLLNLIKK